MRKWIKATVATAVPTIPSTPTVYRICSASSMAWIQNYRFDRAPQMLEGMNPQEVRAELSVIREAAVEISGRMNRMLSQQRQQIRQEPEH